MLHPVSQSSNKKKTSIRSIFSAIFRFADINGQLQHAFFHYLFIFRYLFCPLPFLGHESILSSRRHIFTLFAVL